jgi:trigger factor
MQTAVEPLDGDRVRITVEVPVGDIDHAFEHAIRDLSGSVRIPGFRKGKVPAGVLKARLGTDAIASEALDGHLSRWYGRAMDIAQLEPVDRPTIDYDAPPIEGEPWTFTAEVTVAPTATLPQPLVLRAAQYPVAVADEVVAERLERMRSLAAELEPVEDGAAEAGMQALIDFSSTADGRPLKGGSATDYLVEVGSGRLLDGLEQALIGLRPAETTTVEIDLPDDASDRKLRGKTATFTLTLKELKRRVLPDVDDAFAQAVSEFATADELRADIRRQLEERAAVERDGAYRAAVLTALGEQAIVAVPEAMALRRLDERLEGLARGMARRGIRLEAYLEATGQSISDVIAELRPEAESSARQELALRAFADGEAITASDDELEVFIHEQSAAEKDPEKAARTVLENPAAREAVRSELRLKKALDRAVEIATPVPVDESETAGGDAEEPNKPKLWLPGDPR